MHSHTIGFVGGGRITAISLEALGGSGLALERVTVRDTSAEVLTGLKQRFPTITTTGDNAEAASRQRVFLALHPPALKTVLPAIAPRVPKHAVDLVPVKPLAQAEPRILQAYREALPELYAKLHGTPALAASGVARSRATTS